MKRTPPAVAFFPVVLLAALATPVVFAQSSAAPTEDAVEQQAIASADVPKSRDLSISVEGQKQYDLAVRLYDSAKFSEALAAFKEAIKVRPQDAQAHFMLGMAEARLQLYKEAVESFKRAVRIKPAWPDAQFRLGIVSHVSGRRVLAIDAYTSLVKLKSPLANVLYRVIKEEKNGGASDESVGDDFWSFAEKTRVVVEKVSSPAPEKPSPETIATAKEVIPVPQPVAAGPSLSDIYRIGVGDILDIRLLNSATPRSTLYTVLDGGLIDYPMIGGPLPVAGLTTDEVQLNLAMELKRRAVEENARVTVGVRHYASHTVSISGLVSNPGTKFLRRETVPLYVVMAESQARQDAGRVTIIRAGTETVLDLSQSASLNFMVKSGDLISVTARPQQFYYIGGKISYPGQKVFQSGLTLLQAILAAGGPARQGDNLVELSRENGAGRLGTTKLSLKDIKAGKIADPKLQPGDSIEIVR
ncbi:MAG: tetratricopeptide repeat protein [Acidobacteriota bacterium]|nr:tetratricopeptide repeat protein [Acidobacteriota bacterium]